MILQVLKQMAEKGRKDVDSICRRGSEELDLGDRGLHAGQQGQPNPKKQGRGQEEEDPDQRGSVSQASLSKLAWNPNSDRLCPVFAQMWHLWEAEPGFAEPARGRGALLILMYPCKDKCHVVALSAGTCSHLAKGFTVGARSKLENA